MFGIAMFVILLCMQFGLLVTLTQGTIDKSAEIGARIFNGILLTSTLVFCFYINKFMLVMIS